MSIQSAPLRNQFIAGSLLAGVLMLGALRHAQAQRIYSFQEIGTFGGDDSWAQALNDAGDVVGTARTSTDNLHAFLYDGTSGELINLGSLFGSGSAAFDINNSRQIAGGSTLPSGSGRRAFLYQNGVMEDIGTLGGGRSMGLGINEHGHVVGYASDMYGNELPFVYKHGTMSALNGNFFLSYASNINNTGVIVGRSRVDSSHQPHAFKYSDGQAEDLGAFNSPFNFSSAADINDSGLIVGESTKVTSVGSQTHAVVFAESNIVDLGTLYGDSSGALAVNNQGDIVGRSNRADLPPRTWFSAAFLYKDGAMVDLNLLTEIPDGWVLGEAWDINESGQIVGSGRNPDGLQRAYLLTPERSIESLANYRLVQELRRTIVDEDAPPRVTALFVEDGTPGTVQLYLSAIGLLTENEFISQWLFNLDPELDPSQLVFTLESAGGQAVAPTISIGRDTFDTGGASSFDIQFLFSDGRNNSERFNADESFVYTISGIDSLTVDSFAFSGNDQGIYGRLSNAALIGGLGMNGEGAAWFSTVPEPPSWLLLLVGMLMFAIVLSNSSSR